MSLKTDAQLAAQAEEIRTETQNKANTANRIGTMHSDTNDSKVNKLFLVDWDFASMPDNDQQLPAQPGIIYVAVGDYGSNDPESSRYLGAGLFIPSGTWFGSAVAEPTLFSHFRLNI
jgi:hypothetical protein